MQETSRAYHGCTCRLRLPGWFTCPNRNWPIQASVASRASASVADCSQCLSRKYEAAQHPDPPPHPPPCSSASRPPPVTTPPATLLPISLPLFNTSVLSTARSSPLPARCRLGDLALGSLDCCPMQLGLSVATTPAGSERPSTRHYCGVRLWRDREIHTCRSLMDPTHVACFFILWPLLVLAFLATRHPSADLADIHLSQRNWRCATVTVVHAGAQRRSSTAHSKGRSALAVFDAPNGPQPKALNVDAGLLYGRPGRWTANCKLSAPYMAGSHR